MAHNLILFIYCSKQHGIKIRASKRSIPGIYLDITAAKKKVSLRSICCTSKKQRQLKSGDYIIAIDDPGIIQFEDDYAGDGLLHFASLSIFLEWFSESFEVISVVI